MIVTRTERAYGDKETLDIIFSLESVKWSVRSINQIQGEGESPTIFIVFERDDER